MGEFESLLTQYRAEIEKNPEIRISCAAFALIIDRDGKIALIFNKHSLHEKKEKILTPIGGAIEVTPKGKEFLIQSLGISEAAFEKGNDLRLTLKQKEIDGFIEWFISGKDRETSPLRELTEELIAEYPSLNADDLGKVVIGQPVLKTQYSESNRRGKEGTPTLRLIEVYPVTLPDEALTKLINASADPESMIRFVTPNEIESGITSDGTKIGPVAQVLII